METHLAPQTEAQLQHLAASQGKDPARLAEETLTRILQQQAQFVADVQEGIEASHRGDVITHEEVVSRIERLFQP